MNAQLEEINKVQKRLTVELSSEEVATAFNAVYNNLKKKANIKGFRPGKAPLNIIKQQYGANASYEVMDRLVKGNLFKAIEDNKLNPIAAPVLETTELPKQGEAYKFSALVDILPEINLEGYKGMELEVKEFKVDESAVAREVEMIQRRQATTQDLEEGAVAGDDMIATISQKASIEGSDFPAFTFDSVPAELGKAYLLPEVEEGLKGMKVGEEKTIAVKIPENFPEADKVGKTADCVIKVEKLQSLTIPAANDELAKDMGLEDFATLEKNIRDGLEKQAEQARRQTLESAIFEQLSKKNDLDVPPSIVDQVIDSIFDEQQFEDEKKKAAAKKDPKQREAFLDVAKQRAKNTLMLSEIIKAESIEVEDADIDTYVKSMVGGAAAGDLDAKLLDSIKASMGPQVKEAVLFKKAIDFVINDATVKSVEA